MLIEIGLEQNSTVASLGVSEVITEVKISFEILFTDDEVKSGLNGNEKVLLSMPDASKSKSPPRGLFQPRN